MRRKVPHLYNSIIIGILGIFIFLGNIPLTAGGWYRMSHNDEIVGFVDAVSLDGGVYQLYALGQFNMFYKTENGGYSWDMSTIGSENDLVSITAAYDGENAEYVAIAAGTNGSIWRYQAELDQWSPAGEFEPVNYNVAYFNPIEGSFWVGGDSSMVYISYNFGRTWHRDTLDIENLNVLHFTTDYSNLYLIGSRNDTTFVLKKDYYMITYKAKENKTAQLNIRDSIPQFEPVAVYLMNSQEGYNHLLLLLGKNTVTGETEIYSKDLASGQFTFTRIFTGELGNVKDLNGFGSEPNSVLWISTEEGAVWESRDRGENWQKIYADPDNTPLGPIVTSDYDGDHGRILGANGLVLKYGFEFFYSSPPVNGMMTLEQNAIMLRFSQVPDMESVSAGVQISSRYHGRIPFYPEYDSFDSTVIFLELDDMESVARIPGDVWNITLSEQLQERTLPNNQLMRPVNMDLTLIPVRNSVFKWEKYKQGMAAQYGMTNFVTGLFNNDDALDLITFTGDSLICFSGDTVFTQPVTRLYFPETISLDPHIRKQLVVINLDHDGRPDLILYDGTSIHLLVNTSQGDGFEFQETDFVYSGDNIRQVIPYNKNNNDQVDLLVLANNIYTIPDVNVDSLVNFTVNHEIQTNTYRQIQVGDINADGYQDLVMIDNNGSLIFRAGDTSETFSYDKIAYTLKQGYEQVNMADLDGNGTLEILARDGAQIEVYTLNNVYSWRFDSTEIQVIASTTGSTIVDFVVQDFGGIKNENTLSVLDVALITTDSLEIFENVVTTEKVYLFRPRRSEFIDVPFSPRFLLYGDFNMDGLLDLCLSEQEGGNFTIWTKLSWKPEVTAQMLRRNQITLTWDPLPDTLGVLDYYRVLRDTVPFRYNPDAFIRQTNTNQFVDWEVENFRSYWYSVQAVYDGGIESDWSEPMLMETFIALNGEQYAALDDSTRPYLVQSSIHVPAGTEFEILPGARIAFSQGTGLDVYGGLRVSGQGDVRMVEMFPFNYESEAPWKGIHIYAGTDTVHMEWFSIFGAEIGLKAENRPLKMRYAGIIKNQIGLDFAGDSLYFQNMVFDSNLTAISLGAGSRTEVRNITVTHSAISSLVASGDARAKVRNAIFWANAGPVVKENSDTQLSFSYSTVDSLQPDIQQTEISRLAPVFMPPDSGEFRPAYMSPTIDAGDPSDDFSNEPQPNGGRINQGVFGGLFYATRSFQPRLRILTPEPIRFAARPGASDSLTIGLYNFGHTELMLYDARVAQDTTHFKILMAEQLPVAPGDTSWITVIFQPEERISYNDMLQFVCNDPHLVQGILQVSIEGEGLNSPPVIVGTPPHLAKVASLYSYQIQAQDLDNDPLQFRALSLPQWLQLSNDGVLSGTPALKDTGNYEIQIEVDDGFGGIAPLNFLLRVGPGDLKYIPDVLLSALPSAVIKEAAVRFHFTVQDSNVLTGLTPPNTNRIRYFLFNATTGDTIALVDTIGISEVRFYPLVDGAYVFRIWAYNQKLMGQKGEKAQTALFAIQADRRSTIRFRWYMMAFPREETIDWNTFQLGDSSAVLLHWDNAEEEYVPVSRTELTPGQAFWMLPLKQITLDVSSFENRFKGQVAVELQQGWDQVGIPVNYSVRWQDIRFRLETQDIEVSFLEAVKAGYLEPAVFWFVQSAESQGYDWSVVDTATVAWPWRGYWVNAKTAGQLIFTNQPAFASDSSLQITPIAKRNAGDPIAGQGWQMSLHLSNKQYNDYKNVFGMYPTDVPVVSEPPHFGDFCSLTFTTPQGAATQFIQEEFTDLSDVKTWQVQVYSKNTDQEHVLSWDNQSASDQNLYVYLVDMEREEIIPMHQETEYRFKPSQNVTRFKIYATQDASFKPQIVPLVYKLQQNYPNPFNPKTTIRFGLPEEADGKQVTLKIFDVLGREVRTLYSGKLSKGYHKFEWDGTNQARRQVASGVYFYQLISGKKKLVRKMVLLR